MGWSLTHFSLCSHLLHGLEISSFLLVLGGVGREGRKLDFGAGWKGDGRY